MVVVVGGGGEEELRAFCGGGLNQGIQFVVGSYKHKFH